MRHEPVELLHIEVRHLRNLPRILVLDRNRDNSLFRHGHRRRVPHLLYSVAHVLESVALLHLEPIDDRLRHSPAPQDAHQQVTVRRERWQRNARHLLQQPRRRRKPAHESGASAFLRGEHRRRGLVELRPRCAHNEHDEHRDDGDREDQPAVSPHDTGVVSETAPRVHFPHSCQGNPPCFMFPRRPALLFRPRPAAEAACAAAEVHRATGARAASPSHPG